MGKVLIDNTMIITMDGEDKIINNGYILVEDDKIVKLSSGKYKGDTEGMQVIDGSNCVCMPGLINCHTHVPMTLVRGYGEGLPLMKWLNEKIWPFEAKLTGDDIRWGASLGVIEMIKSGTTCFLDMYFREDVVGEVCENIGARGYVGGPVIGDDYEKQINECLELNKRFKDSKLITTVLAPHSPYTCKDSVIKYIGEKARENKLPVHIHISETLDEVKIIKDTYNTTSIKLCEANGLFDNLNVIAAHCVHVNDEDIDIMAKYKVNAVYNPQSNMKLASGTAPVIQMQKKGVNVAIGTDGASSNNNLDLIEEMQTGSLLQKLSTKDATSLGAYDTLSMATVNGARALCRENELGKLKEGFLADIILLDLNKPHMTPLNDIYSNIVFSSKGADVKTVIINGKIVMEDYKLKTIDEELVMRKVKKVVPDILAR